MKENLVVGWQVLRCALNAKSLYLIVLGSHLVVGMTILNIVVRPAIIYGGLTGQTHNHSLEQTLGSAAQFNCYPTKNGVIQWANM